MMSQYLYAGRDQKFQASKNVLLQAEAFCATEENKLEFEEEMERLADYRL